jgi:hypothetical protein
MKLNGPFAFFENGVFASVLEEMLAVQEKLPHSVTFLQPRGGVVAKGLRDHPPTQEAPIPIYVSITTDLSHVSYVGELVGWCDKRDMSEADRVLVDAWIREHQPREQGLRLTGTPEVNLLVVRDLRRLTTPISVAELVKRSDGFPLSTHRTTSGNWSYVYPLTAERLVEKPAEHMSPDWTEMYRLELGIDPSDQHQLLTAVTKDTVVAHQGDAAARRRVAAYYRAQRAFNREHKADERQAAEGNDAATDEN